jgi:hypothetical protein
VELLRRLEPNKEITPSSPWQKSFL